jgi:succinate dehydrogenase/fumarate reductase-like Fe-S protein
MRVSDQSLKEIEGLIWLHPLRALEWIDDLIADLREAREAAREFTEWIDHPDDIGCIPKSLVDKLRAVVEEGK